MSWKRSRFSQWEVEGEVRQRVGNALAQAERDRMADQCQVMREWPVVAGAIWRLKASLSLLMARAGAWVRAPQVLEKGAGEAKETG